MNRGCGISHPALITPTIMPELFLPFPINRKILCHEFVAIAKHLKKRNKTSQLQ
jgi:hypothetical protein